MPSSKFNRHPTPRLRPPTCYPPPGSCYEAWVYGLPPFITGYIHWRDWHPPVPINWYTILQIHRIGAETRWAGKRFFPGGWLELEVYPWIPMESWNVYLHCHIEPDQWMFHHWDGITSVSKKFFDTGLLTMVNPIGIDFREVHVMGENTPT